MNIFVLDEEPNLVARYHCDKHVVKMILELAQMLCTAHRELDGVDRLDGVELYKSTHKNHPCSKWVRESIENYMWAFKHFRALGDEYARRYGKIHATRVKYWDVLGFAPANISPIAMTPFAQAMPDEYKNDDAVTAYRAYYKGAKHDIAKWKLGAPEWWNE